MARDVEAEIKRLETAEDSPALDATATAEPDTWHADRNWSMPLAFLSALGTAVRHRSFGAPDGAKDFTVIQMSPDENKQELAHLKQLNDELSSSLKRCRRLLHEYEVRLTANSNEAERPDAAGESREAGSKTSSG